MKYKITITLLLITSYSFSQVAGYMGKRFVIGYDNYFLPAFKGPGANSAGPSDEFSLGFNTVSCLNIDYAIKQRTNFCFSVQYLKTGIAYKRNASGYSDVLSFTSNTYPGEVTYGGDYSTPAQLSSINLGIGFKFFKKGCIAPVGGYRKLELLLLFETVKYNNTKFFKPDPNYNQTIPYTAGTGEYNYTNFAITYTLGKQRIFFDKLVLDYGIRFGIIPAVVPSFVFGQDLMVNMEDSYRIDSRYRLFREQLLNFHIGIGFLAF